MRINKFPKEIQIDKKIPNNHFSSSVNSKQNIDIQNSRDKLNFAKTISKQILYAIFIISLFKLVQDYQNNTPIKLESYTNFLIPIMTSTIGFIIGKSSK